MFAQQTAFGKLLLALEIFGKGNLLFCVFYVVISREETKGNKAPSLYGRSKSVCRGVKPKWPSQSQRQVCGVATELAIAELHSLPVKWSMAVHFYSPTDILCTPFQILFLAAAKSWRLCDTDEGSVQESILLWGPQPHPTRLSGTPNTSPAWANGVILATEVSH